MPRKITDPYEVLGLDRNATDADVRAAYLRLVKKHHPDKNPGDKASEWIFKEVQCAYEALSGAKGVQPGMQWGPPPSQPDRDAPGRWTNQQRQAERKHSAPAQTRRTSGERRRADSIVRRSLRWAKWTIYCSNALLWPLALAGHLEWLPDRVGVLVFGWMTLGTFTLAWDFALKDAVEQVQRAVKKRR